MGTWLRLPLPPTSSQASDARLVVEGHIIHSYTPLDLSNQAFSGPVLTYLGRYIPGHIHAFYLEYVYYERKEKALRGEGTDQRAPGVYSQHITHGGESQGYGTIAQPVGTVQ